MNTHQFLIAIDQLINTCIKIKGDGRGFADETISARCFRAHLQGYISDRPMRFVNAIFFWQENHCYHAWRSEVERKQYPSYYKEQP